MNVRVGLGLCVLELLNALNCAVQLLCLSVIIHRYSDIIMLCRPGWLALRFIILSAENACLQCVQVDGVILEFSIVKIDVPEDVNVILGTAHFIKTVEDLYEALINTVPGIKFGLGFCESSGPCLIRSEGNDQGLRDLAVKHALELGCGHSFIIFIKNAYPINVLESIKGVPEVCTIHAATANPLQVIVAETEQGRGILGVIDGMKSKGIETDVDVKTRREFLRKIGYKL